MAAEPSRILLTGATGYIGGTVLSNLLNSTSLSLQGATISCLLRGKDRATTLSSHYGKRVNPIIYEGLDDVKAITRMASKHDIVINTTIGFHAASAAALIRGLAERKAQTGHDVWMIHTSGVSNIGDRPISQPGVPPHDWDDAFDDVYAFEKKHEVEEAYAQRTTELGVIDTGLELGVKTIVIMSPIVYGFGTGVFNKIIQAASMKPIFQLGRGVVLGDGKGAWDHVHVEDLAELYILVLRNIIEMDGQSVPTGKKGIIFSAAGRHTWVECTQDQVNAIHELGYILQNQVDFVGLKEAAKILGPSLGFMDEHGSGQAERMVEIFASNAMTKANLAKRLGWSSKKGEKDWKQAFFDDAKVVRASLDGK